MKIKLDENLPARLSQILSALGHDTDTIVGEGLAGRRDPDIWEETQKVKRFFVTQDLDFSDLRKFVPGKHHGILLLRLREPGRLALTQRVETIFQNENVENWKRCFVIVTDHKIRIKHPSRENSGT